MVCKVLSPMSQATQIFQHDKGRGLKGCKATPAEQAAPPERFGA